MMPTRYRVIDRTPETADTATLALEPVDAPLPVFRPGQFAMLYAFGVGEVPISVSGRRGPGPAQHVPSIGGRNRLVFGRQLHRLIQHIGEVGRQAMARFPDT